MSICQAATPSARLHATRNATIVILIGKLLSTTNLEDQVTATLPDRAVAIVDQLERCVSDRSPAPETLAQMIQPLSRRVNCVAATNPSWNDMQIRGGYRRTGTNRSSSSAGCHGDATRRRRESAI